MACTAATTTSTPLWATGDYFGIELGYAPGTDFGTYGLGGTDNHELRGARVFEVDENKDRVYTGTRTTFANDPGIDMSSKTQPIVDPLPLTSRQMPA